MLEIVVVDNASVDGSAELVETEFPGVIIVRTEENRGFAAAMNLGLAAASADYFLALNPDTFVPPGSLLKMLKFMKQHPMAAVAGAGLTYPDGYPQASTFGTPSLFREFWSAWPELKVIFKLRKISEILRWNPGVSETTKPVQVCSISGAAFIGNKALVEAVGGFDAGFFLYHEERDLCFRLRKTGHEVWFYPDAQIIHFEAQASGYQQSRLPGMPVLEWRTLGMGRLWRKHKPHTYWLWKYQTIGLFRLRLGLLKVGQLFTSGERKSRIAERVEELRLVVAQLNSEKYEDIEFRPR
jgi:N-acetylglucosaminyl-diphospho-decaprenol L-rhamnosyltransferase